MIQVSLLALIYVIGAFHIYAVTEPGSVGPISACEEALLGPSVRLLNRAFAEGVVSRDSLSAWLEGKATSPVLVKSFSSAQLPLVQGLERLLASHPLKTDRAAIESWMARLQAEVQQRQSSREETAFVLSPLAIANFEEHFAKGTVPVLQNPVLQAEADGTLKFVVAYGDSIRIHIWTPEQQFDSVRHSPQVQTIQLNADVKNWAMWNLAFTKSGELKGLALADGHPVAVDFSKPVPEIKKLAKQSKRPGSSTQFVGPDWAASFYSAKVELVSTSGAKGHLIMERTPKPQSVWTDANGRTFALETNRQENLLRYERIGAKWTKTVLLENVEEFDVVHFPNGQTVILAVDFLRPRPSTKSRFQLRFLNVEGQDVVAPMALPAGTPEFAPHVTPDGRLLLGLKSVIVSSLGGVAALMGLTEGSSLSLYEPLKSPEPIFTGLNLPNENQSSPILNWAAGFGDEPVLMAEGVSNLHFYSISFGQPKHLLKVDRPNGFPPREVIYSSDGRYFAFLSRQSDSGDDYRIQIYSVYRKP